MGLTWNQYKSLNIASLVANIIYLSGLATEYGFAYGKNIFSIPSNFIAIGLNVFILWAIYQKYIN